MAVILRLFLSALLLSLALPLYAGSRPDPSNLHLASVNAMIVDMRSGRVLYRKNPDHVVPIASVSKLMTAIVTLDAKLPMNEHIPIEVDESPVMDNVFSRIRIGSQLRRRDVLLLALMSSENRAATALAQAYPGGFNAFIKAMNAKARALGMRHSHFVEPTGLSPHNVSTASDLVKLLRAASHYSTIRKITTTSKTDARFRRPHYVLAFYNTDPLVNRHSWDIRLSKTGFTDEAGRCLVLWSRIKGREIGMVLLDSYGKRTHLADAQRVRRWLETGHSGDVPRLARRYEEKKVEALAAARAAHGHSDTLASR